MDALLQLTFSHVPGPEGDGCSSSAMSPVMCASLASASSRAAVSSAMPTSEPSIPLSSSVSFRSKEHRFFSDRLASRSSFRYGFTPLGGLRLPSMSSQELPESGGQLGAGHGRGGAVWSVSRRSSLGVGARD